MPGIEYPSEAHEAGFGDVPWQGVFLMKGQSLDLSSFTITEHEDGSITSTSPIISTSTHMAPYWLEAAVRHARDAERMGQSPTTPFGPMMQWSGSKH